MSDLLPPNATALERNVAATNAPLGDLPVLLRDLMQPDSCPSEFLPWLAQHLSVDAWEVEWSDEQKRETIKESLSINRVKGTIGAVRRALSALGIGVQLKEWFNQIPIGAPYTYQLLLHVSQVGIKEGDLNKITEVVGASKNLRSHLSSIQMTVASSAPTMSAGMSAIGNDIVIKYGHSDVHLLLEGAKNGMAETEIAVDALQVMLHQTMPTSNYW